MSGGLLKDELAPALRVLKQLGGSITFTDDDGEEFVIARRQDVAKGSKETQLELPSSQVVANAIRRNIPGDIDERVVERINRDIALAASASDETGEIQEEQQTEDDLSPNYIRPTPPPSRVRFEPLRGDLPPQLQE